MESMITQDAILKPVAGRSFVVSFLLLLLWSYRSVQAQQSNDLQQQQQQQQQLQGPKDGQHSPLEEMLLESNNNDRELLLEESNTRFAWLELLTQEVTRDLRERSINDDSSSDEKTTKTKQNHFVVEIPSSSTGNTETSTTGTANEEDTSNTQRSRGAFRENGTNEISNGNVVDINDNELDLSWIEDLTRYRIEKKRSRTNDNNNAVPSGGEDSGNAPSITPTRYVDILRGASSPSEQSDSPNPTTTASPSPSVSGGTTTDGAIRNPIILRKKYNKKENLTNDTPTTPRKKMKPSKKKTKKDKPNDDNDNENDGGNVKTKSTKEPKGGGKGKGNDNNDGDVGDGGNIFMRMMMRMRKKGSPTATPSSLAQTPEPTVFSDEPSLTPIFRDAPIFDTFPTTAPNRPGRSPPDPEREFAGELIDQLINSFLKNQTTITPTGVPTSQIIGTPTEGSDSPSTIPSYVPSLISSNEVQPSLGVINIVPSAVPSNIPSSNPSDIPSDVPSATPSSTPSDIPTLAIIPTIDRVQVQLDPYSMAFSASLADRDPEPEEYNALNEQNMLHFREYFRNLNVTDNDDDTAVVKPAKPYTNMIQIQSNITSTIYNGGIPDPSFNIYIEFDAWAYIDLNNTLESSPLLSLIANSASSLFDLPVLNPDQIYREMKRSIGPKYIFRHVRALNNTPFASTNAVFFKRLVKVNTTNTTTTENSTSTDTKDDPTNDASIESFLSKLELLRKFQNRFLTSSSNSQNLNNTVITGKHTKSDTAGESMYQTTVRLADSDNVDSNDLGNLSSDKSNIDSHVQTERTLSNPDLSFLNVIYKGSENNSTGADQQKNESVNNTTNKPEASDLSSLLNALQTLSTSPNSTIVANTNQTDHNTTMTNRTGQNRHGYRGWYDDDYNNDDDYNQKNNNDDYNDDNGLSPTELANLFKVLSGGRSRNRRRRWRGKGKGKGGGNYLTGKGGNIIIGGKGKGKGKGNGSNIWSKMDCIYYDDDLPVSRGDYRSGTVNNGMAKSVLFRKGTRGSKKKGKSKKSSKGGGKGGGKGGSSKGDNSDDDSWNNKGKGWPSTDNNYVVLNLNNLKGLFKNVGKGSESFKKNRSCAPKPSQRPTRQPSDRTRRPTSKPILVTRNPTTKPNWPPVPTPSQRPTKQNDNGQPLNIPRYFISMVSPGARVGPTKAEYKQMLDITTEYFTQFFIAYFADDPNTTFLRLENQLLNTAFELGYPEPRYNIYMDYKTSLILTEDSVQPNNAEIFEVMRASINDDYILNWVRTAVETPFEFVNEVYFARVPNDLVIPQSDVR